MDPRRGLHHPAMEAEPGLDVGGEEVDRLELPALLAVPVFEDDLPPFPRAAILRDEVVGPFAVGHEPAPVRDPARPGLPEPLVRGLRLPLQDHDPGPSGNADRDVPLVRRPFVEVAVTVLPLFRSLDVDELVVDVDGAREDEGILVAAQRQKGLVQPVNGSPHRYFRDLAGFVDGRVGEDVHEEPDERFGRQLVVGKEASGRGGEGLLAPDPVCPLASVLGDPQ